MPTLSLSDDAHTDMQHHITPDTTGTDPLDPRGMRYSDAVKELARACWFECHGNAGRAHSLLVTECQSREARAGLADVAQIPSERAIQRWARDLGWEAEFTGLVGQSYRHTMEHLTARLIRTGGNALDTLETLSRPEYVPTKEDKTKLDAAKFIVTTLGLGTTGSKVGPATMAPVEIEQQPEFTDAAEANRYWLEQGKR